ncbi:BPL-N domain-containing protein [Deinococcus sp. UYEF24]
MTAATGQTPRWWTEVQAQLVGSLPDLHVAFYASGGSPYHHAALVAHWGGTPVPLSAESIATGGLSAFDVLIMPGGGLNGMGGLLRPLGRAGAEAIRAWVEAGGRYIGSCAGAYLPTRWPEGFAHEHAEQRAFQLLDLRVANASEGGLGGLDSPGVGVVEANVQDAGHWLSAGLPPRFPVMHYNGPCFLPPSDWGVTRLVGYGEAFTPWEHMLEGPAEAGPVLADALIRQEASNVVAAPYGAGSVVLFGSHPEFGFSSLQLGWGVAARLFGNALAMTARREFGGEFGRTVSPTPAAHPNLAHLADAYQHAADRLIHWQFARPSLQTSPGFLGQAASALWRDGLLEAAGLGQAVALALRGLDQTSPVPAKLQHWLDTPAAADQDYGFVGLVQLAERIHALIDQSDTLYGSSPPVSTSPYGDWPDHPYHLLVSSYLSASGLMADAALATGTLIRLGGYDVPVPHPLFSTDRSHHD